MRLEMCSILGMQKRYLVKLTAAERESLEQLVRRERVSGRKRQRASILLRADDGLTDEEIADELNVGLRTVERVRQRCCERGIEACLERKPQENPSRPRKFDGSSEAELIRIACSPPPRGRARWTLALLADQLVELEVFDSVSASSVQRVLKKTRSNPGASSASASRPSRTRPSSTPWRMCSKSTIGPTTRRAPMSRECLEQRIGTMAQLRSKIAAWKNSRPSAKVSWRFTTADARLKLRRLYPIIS
jgi:transposase